jgi:CubicO group peptidase (beta-lactamase class C family)
MSALLAPPHPAPDEALLGRDLGYPVGTAQTYFYDEAVRVGSFSRTHEIDFSPGRWGHLKAQAAGVSDSAAPPMRLPPAPQAEAFARDFSYVLNGQRLGLADHLARQRVMGWMVLQAGQRWCEAYQYGCGPQHRFLGHSLAKSVASLAFGLALAEGRLPSLDARVDALAPAFAGTLYGQATLRHLLHMASGVRFEDRYDGLGDTAKFSRVAAQDGIAAAARCMTAREAQDGMRFSYASAQSSVLSQVFQTVVDEDLATYCGPRLWQCMGAERDALWLQDRFGVVRASGSFCATLADYARLGALLANDGARPDTGAQVLPRDWLLQATDWQRHPPAFRPGAVTPHMGYGLHFWTLPGQPRRFAMVGVYGQFIFVAPDLQLAMVQMSAGAEAKNGDTALAQEAHALWQGLIDFFSKGS